MATCRIKEKICLMYRTSGAKKACPAEINPGQAGMLSGFQGFLVLHLAFWGLFRALCLQSNLLPVLKKPILDR